ncbi:MAG: hypothetical protein EA425_06175 [Puniceicoccaceae bacterium]|nr:MAG: hypothetical protein EA425_06175 [Puniceicoccaceae bacterium]
MRDPRGIIVALIGLGLLFFTAEANHFLALLGLTVFFGGLPLAFAALFFRLRQGVLCAAVLGLAMGAGLPGSPLPVLALFLFSHAVIFALRPRLHAHEATSRTIAVLLANAICFLGLSLLYPPPLWALGSWLGRLGLEFFLSQLMLMGMTPWLFSLTDRTLNLFGIIVEEELRELS